MRVGDKLLDECEKWIEARVHHGTYAVQSVCLCGGRMMVRKSEGCERSRDMHIKQDGLPAVQKKH